MTEQTKTISLDGVTYEVSQFSSQIQNAVDIYNTINADLQKEQIAVIKTQAALQSIGAQIGSAVKKELAEKADAEAVVQAPAVQAAPVAEVEAEVTPVAEG